MSIRLVSSSNPNYYVTIFIDNKIRNKHWSNNCNKKVTPRRRWNIRIRLMLLAFTFLFGKGYIYIHIYIIYILRSLRFMGKKSFSLYRDQQCDDYIHTYYIFRVLSKLDRTQRPIKPLSTFWKNNMYTRRWSMFMVRERQK